MSDLHVEQIHVQELDNTNTIFLFANPISGSRKAKLYLKLQTETLVMRYKGHTKQLFIFNLADRHSRQRGLWCLQQHLREDQLARVIAAGGDGSLIWLIEEMISGGIDFTKVALGVLPFGSGNDLAATLGWGREPETPIIGEYMKGLRKSMKKWCKAKEAKFDIWQITIEVQEDGRFIKIGKNAQGKTEKQIMTDDQGTKILTFRRLMTNYFSIGLDARIGLNFDKKRSGYKCCNKCVYCWEGFKKMCCFPARHITEFFTSFVTEESNQTICDTQSIHQSATVLLALNCRTHGGGDNFIWDRAKTGGVHSVNDAFQVQCSYDKMLEWVTFPKLGLMREQARCCAGSTRKVFQGTGPFVINMQSPDENYRVYIQIDGEYFYALRPREVRVERSPISDDLVILVNPDKRYQ